MIREVVLVSPRGHCAGVVRAIASVERALTTFGPPVFVRRAIVHNSHVVARFAAAGAIFVKELDEVPEGAVVVFSAHGVAPSVRERANEKHLRVVDATCPLVAKIHRERRVKTPVVPGLIRSRLRTRMRLMIAPTTAMPAEA